MKRSIFLGKFSPFHKGHEYLIRQKLNTGKPVLILIRDTDDGGKYSTQDILTMIELTFEKDDVLVFIIPDVDEFCYGRTPAFSVEEITNMPKWVGEISATRIRNSIAANTNEWESMVPNAVRQYLAGYHNLDI